MGVATKLVDLYCEAATVSELADLYRLGLSDQEIAAHLLMLWGITEDAEEADAAVDPTRAGTIAGLVIGQAREKVVVDPSDSATVLRAGRALWTLRGSVVGTERPTTAQSVRGWLFARRRAKQLVTRAKQQLAVGDDHRRAITPRDTHADAR